MIDNGRRWYRQRETDRAFRERLSNQIMGEERCTYCRGDHPSYVCGHWHVYHPSYVNMKVQGTLVETPDAVITRMPYQSTFTIPREIMKIETTKVIKEVKLTSEKLRITSFSYSPGKRRQPYYPEGVPAELVMRLQSGDAEDIKYRVVGPEADKLHEALSEGFLFDKKVKLTLEFSDG